MSKVSPIQPKLLSKINERLVMRMIQDEGPSTRGEISKYIGVTFPTIAKAVSSLLDSKLLEEAEESSPGPGRPAKRLRLASECSQVIGVSLGGVKCSVTSGDLDGVVHEDRTLSFPTSESYDSLLVSITSHIKRLMPRGGKSTLGVGISVPAVIDYRKQVAIFSANLPLINGKPIGKDLQSLLGQECVIVHDSHALSLSERLHGGAKGETNFAMLDHCVGIGLGMMVDGQFFTGESGFAGELGHLVVVPNGEMCHCGKRGCLETVASEWALESRMSLLLRRPVGMDEILALVQAGDAQAQLELKKMCKYLAMGMSYIVNIVNPGTFYVFGQTFSTCPEMLDLLVQETEKLALDPSFSSCKFLCASGSLLEGTIASVINYLTESLVPNLDGYHSL